MLDNQKKYALQLFEDGCYVWPVTFEDGCYVFLDISNYLLLSLDI